MHFLTSLHEQTPDRSALIINVTEPVDHLQINNTAVTPNGVSDKSILQLINIFHCCLEKIKLWIKSADRVKAGEIINSEKNYHSCKTTWSEKHLF